MGVDVICSMTVHAERSGLSELRPSFRRFRRVLWVFCPEKG
jgi:hypothetical protein